MDIWILRFLEARERLNASRQLIVLQRTDDGQVTEVEILEIEARNMNLPDVVENQVTKGHSRIVFDLQSEKRLDSNDLAQLIGAAKYAKDAGGEVVFANPNARNRELLRITHLDEVMPVFDSIGAASEHFSSSA